MSNNQDFIPLLEKRVYPKVNVEQVLNTRCVESERQTRQSTYSQVIAIQVQLGLITSNVQDLDCVPNEDVDLHLVVRGTREREVGG